MVDSLAVECAMCIAKDGDLNTISIITKLKTDLFQIFWLMFYKKQFLLTGLLLTGFALFWACRGDKDKKIPDVSSVEVKVKIHRFDRDLFAIDTNEVKAGVEKLEAQYPAFSDFYFTNVLQLKKPWDTTGVYKDYLKGFLTYPFVRKLRHKVDSTYRDFSKIEKQLQQGFQFYKYYFPDKEIPEFYTFISEFTYGIVLPPIENCIGIGLDLFLGKDFSYYYFPPLNLPKYIARTQDEKHLAAKIFEGLVDDLLGEVNGVRFIDYIIHNGKKIYLLDHLLPYEQDSVKLGFTSSQTEWIARNEAEIWAYILTQELLYSDEYQDFKTLISIAPHSAGMPEEAPGKAGNWLGWQIVKAYMERNPGVSLQDLVALEDVQEILNKSRYKPRRG